MTYPRQAKYSRDHVVFTFRRVGYEQAAVEAQWVLPDPVTYEQIEAFAAHYGITFDEILSRLGASP